MFHALRRLSQTVDHRIEEGAEKDVERGGAIEREPRGAHRARQQRADQGQPGRVVRQRAGHEGALARARHEAVALMLDVLIERAGAGGRRQHRQREHQHLRRREPGAGRDHEPDERGDHDQEPDAQLEQRKHVAGQPRWPPGRQGGGVHAGLVNSGPRAAPGTSS
jgi:hypothetical protein